MTNKKYFNNPVLYIIYYGGIGVLIYGAVVYYQAADWRFFGVSVATIFLLIVACGKAPLRPFFPIYFDQNNLCLYPFLWQKTQIKWKDIDRIEQSNRFDVIIIKTKDKKYRLSFLMHSLELKEELNRIYNKQLKKQSSLLEQEVDKPQRNKKKAKKKTKVQFSSYEHLDLAQDIYQKDGVYYIKRNELIPTEDFDFKLYTNVYLNLVAENALEMFLLEEEESTTIGVIVFHVNQKLYFGIAFLEDGIFEADLNGFVRVHPDEQYDDFTKNEKVICLKAEEDYNLRSNIQISIK